ncbi:hypothetical protein L210DRAFT_3649482 [Boletus edulis BED1]|uniref:Uncharacterized protein n=1 Tax=Boletus edulis BED1 TaxID=1328754 RepID=A0AAD4GB59_BOLED|nr:hypothetical protein L210DRAFT_3649482 [Boletus edulis BED1]
MASRSRVRPPRSPAPLRTPTTPSQFFPPSYFAAAAGVSYPPNQHDQSYHPFSSNASYLLTEYSPHAGNPSRTRRKSQLGNLEPQLLPTLSDTVERMTRPPSQLVSSSPFRPIPGPSSSPSIARTPSTSSQGTDATAPPLAVDGLPYTTTVATLIVEVTQSKVDTEISYNI